MRISKDQYYLSIAEAVGWTQHLSASQIWRRNCQQRNEIVATGYNGAPRGEANCVDTGYCQREALNIPKGERYELCVSCHAEMNAVISAARNDMIGSTIYIVGLERDGSYANPAPCIICRRLVVNARYC